MANFIQILGANCFFDITGAPISKGTVKFTQCDGNGNPIPCSLPAGQYGIAEPKTIIRQIREGSMYPEVLQIANEDETSPTGIGFNIEIDDDCGTHTFLKAVSITDDGSGIWDLSKINVGLYVTAVPVTFSTGPIGPAGAPIVWRGVYDNTVTYNLLDSVSYLSSSYICIVNNTVGLDPLDNPSNWNLMAAAGGGSSNLPATSSTFGTVKLAGGQSSAVLATVATTGAYSDLSSLPTLGTISSQNSGAVAITGGTISGVILSATNIFPTLNQATTGNAGTATKLAIARTINGVSFDGSANITVAAAAGTLTGTSLSVGIIVPASQTSGFATVATSGLYSDLSGKPTIPAAQVNSDWNAVSGLAQILNKPSLATVATSGLASDLTGTLAAARLPNTTVTAGSYTNVSLTVDGTGRITAASNGSAGSGMTYPLGNGIAVVTSGSAWGTTIAAPIGAVVGISDVQIITNKDLTSGTNTFPTLNQSTTGNAATATKLATARNINGVAFDGTAAITITAAAGTLTGTALPVGVLIPVGQITGLAASATTDTTAAGNISSGTLLAARMPALTGDVVTTVGTVATTVKAINGTSLAGLATGILKNTTTTGVPSIAVAGTDYQIPVTLTTTGTSGAATFAAGALNIPNYANTTYSNGTGLGLSGTTFSVNASQNITTLSNLSVAGYVKTTSAGLLSSGAIAAADLPVATTGAFGAVKPDGTSITISAGVISAITGGSGTVTSVTSADVTTATVATTTSTPVITIVSAPKLQTARTISISGDLAYTSPSFDGTGNVTAAGTLATVNSNVGSFTNASVTVNAKGLITAVSNGVAGFANPMTTLGDIIYEDVTPTAVRLAGNTSATKKFLSQTGNGTISAAPGWNTIIAGDIPTLNQSTTGSAATLTIPRTINGTAFDGSANITVTVSIATGVSGLGTGVAAFLATPSSANLASAITGGTGTGANVFGTSPTLTTPVIASIVNIGTLTLPTATDTIVGRQTTDTLTNKRNVKRFVTITQSATPTVNTDNGDIFSITGLAQAITSMTTNLTGTPNNGDMYMWQITDNGTARAIVWGASFASTTSYTLPTTTVIATLLRVLTQYNSATSKHECIGVA